MSDLHEDAMALVSEAEGLALAGRIEAARQILERAAAIEERAADASPVERPRTRGILRVSAVSLWLQAGHPARAAKLAARYLDEALAVEFGRELDEIRVMCAREAEAARRLPVVDASVAARAKEREDALARGEIVSARVLDMRAA